MKELSIEEKAKAYDEALKVLHKYDGANIMFSQDLKEEMFPELKENEDERIKGNIIATIHLYYGEPLEDEAKEMIAWLEKQGEEKPIDKVEPKFKVGDIIKPKCYNETHSIKAIGERYYILDVDIKIPFRDEDDWELVGQNSAWSEKDEKMFDYTLNMIDWYGCVDKDKSKPVSDWFKFLKYRIQPQPNPKQEWSEEDEKCIRLSTDIIDSSLRAGFCVQLDRDRCVDWLKSLRPQNWKPSKEQMKYLHKYAEQNNYDGAILTSLYNDLKQLKQL